MNAPRPKLPPRSARWRVVALLMGYAALAHFNRIGISVAGSEIFIPKLGVSETRMGWVYTAFLIVYTLGMLPGGWLIDRIGTARTLTLLGWTMGTCVALTGTLAWATSTTESLWLGLIAVRGLAGMCSAPLHPGAAHVVSDVTPDGARATANGLITAGALLGIAGCYPIFGWLMDRLTWPWAFVVSGGALIAYGGMWRRFAAPYLPGPQSTAPAENEADPKSSRSLVRRLDLWLLTMSYAAYGYFQYLFFYWMSYYFEHELHVADVESRRASFFIMLAQGAGMALGGCGADWSCRMLGTDRGRRSMVIAAMGLSSLFALLAVQLKDPGSVALCLAISLGALGMCEGAFWTTATEIGGRARGTAGAFMNAGGNVGGLISPVLTPFIAAQLGWPAAIGAACCVSAVGALVWLWIKPRSD